jgi:hypothetical protein
MDPTGDGLEHLGGAADGEGVFVLRAMRVHCGLFGKISFATEEALDARHIGAEIRQKNEDRRIRPAFASSVPILLSIRHSACL